MTPPPRAAGDPGADDVAAADGGRVVDRVESLDEDLAGVLRLALRARKVFRWPRIMQVGTCTTPLTRTCF